MKIVIVSLLICLFIVTQASEDSDTNLEVPLGGKGKDGARLLFRNGTPMLRDKNGNVMSLKPRLEEDAPRRRASRKRGEKAVFLNHEDTDTMARVEAHLTRENIRRPKGGGNGFSFNGKGSEGRGIRLRGNGISFNGKGSEGRGIQVRGNPISFNGKGSEGRGIQLGGNGISFNGKGSEGRGIQVRGKGLPWKVNIN